MNFYKHHLGDYDGATAHLSWDEDMAYTRLLRIYYRLEKPLPVSLTDVYRLARATTKTHKAIVERVLREFFEEHNDGWHNRRCDEEISTYQSQVSTNRRIARERTVARTVEPTVNEPSTKGNGHDPSTKHTPNHKPLTKNQEPDKEKETEGSPEPMPPAAEIELMLPTNNGKEYAVLKAKTQEWTVTYPGVDVPRTLIEIRQWCMDNPTRRKTAQGMHAFIGRWMAREQNRGR